MRGKCNYLQNALGNTTLAQQIAHDFKTVSATLDTSAL
jgi:hypothetical protein